MKRLCFISAVLFMACISSLQNTSAASEKHENMSLTATSANISKDNQKLKQEAKRLSENLRTLFNDVSGLSKTIIITLVNRIADWIETSYENLSESKRKDLDMFLKGLENRISGFDEIPENNLGEILKMLEEFIRERESEKTSPYEKEDDSEGIEIKFATCRINDINVTGG